MYRKCKTNDEFLHVLFDKYPSLSFLEKEITEAYQLLCQCVASGHKILICGNGGSCSDAEHIAGELLKGFIKKRPLSLDDKEKLKVIGGDSGEYLAERLQMGIQAIALTSHPGLSTAVINDLGGDMVYAQQVNAYGQEGDVLIGISTSGNSRNVELACYVAKLRGIKVIGLTGAKGGKLKNNSDCCICVPSDSTYEIQEYHLPIYHLLCAWVEGTFFDI